MDAQGMAYAICVAAGAAAVYLGQFVSNRIGARGGKDREA